MKSYTFTSKSAPDTQALAEQFAKWLRGGEIIFLRGPIGAGKTVFVKAIAKALGLKSSPTSASFSLMKHYANARYSLFHIDLFRLEKGEVFNLGFEEMLEDEKAIILAEWPDAIADMMPTDRLEMDFTLCGGDKRKITLRSFGLVSEHLLEAVCQKKSL